jgi:flagellar biosynthetic protein FlhB
MGVAEDSDLERTEDATPRRIQQAREKGQVARSRELTTFVMLVAAGSSFMMMGDQLVGSLTRLLQFGLSFDRSVAFDTVMMQQRLHHQTQDVLIAFVPFLGLMMAAALLTPMLLSGWLFSAEALTPDFGKLNPLKGISRVISVNGLIEMVKAIAKTLLIGGVAWWTILHYKEALFGLVMESSEVSLVHFGQLVLTTFIAVSCSLLLVVAIDVPFQLWDHSQKLKMTKEDIRQEYKESEGDPHVKGRIRQMQREMARKRMMAEVPKADVIVTNPTHYAVALKYESKSMGAPTVVAKGSHLLAERIMDLAKEHHVPVLRTPPLARALYRHAELGEEIPSALYTAVAEVLAYIYQLQRYEKQGGAAPKAPGNLPVPEDMDPGGDEA